MVGNISEVQVSGSSSRLECFNDSILIVGWWVVWRRAGGWHGRSRLSCRPRRRSLRLCQASKDWGLIFRLAAAAAAALRYVQRRWLCRVSTRCPPPRMPFFPQGQKALADDRFQLCRNALRFDMRDRGGRYPPGDALGRSCRTHAYRTCPPALAVGYGSRLRCRLVIRSSRRSALHLISCGVRREESEADVCKSFA